MTCPYCQQPAALVSGRVIYPHRSDLWPKTFWSCAPCGAYVGCHPGGTVPLGRLANKELRDAKMAAHAAFDPIWKRHGASARAKSRRDAYGWLADQMGLSRRRCHIGMFDVEECRRVVEIIRHRGGPMPENDHVPEQELTEGQKDIINALNEPTTTAQGDGDPGTSEPKVDEPEGAPV